MTNFSLELLSRDPIDAERHCVVAPDGSARTWSELLASTARIANALQVAGAQPGACVAAFVDKSFEALELWLACLRAGAVYLPLNTALTPSELKHILADANPSVIVCRPDALESFRALTPHAAHLTLSTDATGTLADAADLQTSRFEDVALDANAPAALLYTSGTTGRPKGALIPQRAIAWCTRTLADLWQFTRDDALVHALPIFHGHGLFLAADVALFSRARMLFLPRFDLDTIVGALPDATVLMGVPTFYNRLVNDGRVDRARCARMRLFTCGSAPLPDAVLDAFEQRTGHRILERYGTTETMIIASNPYYGVRHAGRVGLPLPEVQLRIDATDGQPTSSSAVGRVLVRSPGLFSGYLGHATPALDADGWFDTGDIGVIEDDGHLRLLGRSKEMIITGGYNVYPKEIEQAIEELPGVSEVAVIGVPHPDFGEAVTAVIVPADPCGTLTADSVLHHLRGCLANYKIPKHVHFTSALPRNALGKIQKHLVRDRVMA